MAKKRFRRTIYGRSINLNAREIPIEKVIAEEIGEENLFLMEARAHNLNSSCNSGYGFEDSQDSLGKIAQQNIISEKGIQNANKKFSNFNDYSLILEDAFTGASVPNPPKDRPIEYLVPKVAPREIISALTNKPIRFNSDSTYFDASAKTDQWSLRNTSGGPTDSRASFVDRTQILPSEATKQSIIPEEETEDFVEDSMGEAALNGTINLQMNSSKLSIRKSLYPGGQLLIPEEKEDVVEDSMDCSIAASPSQMLKMTSPQMSLRKDHDSAEEMVVPEEFQFSFERADFNDIMMDSAPILEENKSNRFSLFLDNNKENTAKESELAPTAHFSFDNSVGSQKSVTSFYRTVKQLDPTKTLFYLHDYNGDGSSLSQLLHVCNCYKVGGWKEALFQMVTDNLKKLGEGQFGEVYEAVLKKEKLDMALKVFPFKDDADPKKNYPLVNGSEMMLPGSIITEVVIGKEITRLAANNVNFTKNFVELYKTWIVKGHYPDVFQTAWETYRSKKGTLNTSPTTYSSTTRHYVVMALSLGGMELEKYIIQRPQMITSIFLQIAHALAVGEAEFSFEHRDLHWSNVLIEECDKKLSLDYVLNGRHIKLPTHGVVAKIIDFTNSRIQIDSDIVFMDLSQDDDLFAFNSPDIQFQCYRDMKDMLQNNWEQKCLKTNCVWLDYLWKKMTNFENNKDKPQPIKLNERKKLREKMSKVIEFESAEEFVNSEIVNQLLKQLTS